MPIEQTHPPLQPDAEQCADMLRRAQVAWIKTGGTEPPNKRSAVQTVDGLVYVVLRGKRGVLAVYRARTDNGLLRRMKRWPEAVEQ